MLGKRFITVSCLTFFAATLQGWAQDQPQGNQVALEDGAKGEKDKVEEKPAWKFEDDGSRDPFTFVKLEKAAEETDTDGPIIDRIDQDYEKKQKAKEAAERYYELAEDAFMLNRSSQSMALCDRGLNSFKELAIENEPDLQAIREKLFRLRRAAERLKTRSDAEVAFRSMNLRVTGVVARERKSQAIVNNQLVTRGDLIAAQDESAIIDRILPGRVVVRFRGYKMELRISQ